MTHKPADIRKCLDSACPLCQPGTIAGQEPRDRQDQTEAEAPRSWVESYLKRELTDFQRKAVEILGQACNTGTYNLPVKWETVDWNYNGGVRFKFRGSMETFDFDHLTRLVILAHDGCVRVGIEPLSPKHLAITMYQRRKREGFIYERHPTIDQAVEAIRALEPDDA